MESPRFSLYRKVGTGTTFPAPVLGLQVKGRSQLLIFKQPCKRDHPLVRFIRAEITGFAMDDFSSIRYGIGVNTRRTHAGDVEQFAVRPCPVEFRVEAGRQPHLVCDGSGVSQIIPPGHGVDDPYTGYAPIQAPDPVGPHDLEPGLRDRFLNLSDDRHQPFDFAAMGPGAVLEIDGLFLASRLRFDIVRFQQPGRKAGVATHQFRRGNPYLAAQLTGQFPRACIPPRGFHSVTKRQFRRP